MRDIENSSGRFVTSRYLNSGRAIIHIDCNDQTDRLSLWMLRDESQGSQVLGGARRYRAFRQGGGTLVCQPAHPVRTAQEARGIPRREAGRTSAEKYSAPGSGSTN